MSIFNQSIDYYYRRFSRNSCDHGYFIKKTKEVVLNYNKNTQKVFFLENLLSVVNNKFERHLVFCSTKDCRFVNYFRTIIFYIKSEIDYYESTISSSHLTKSERYSINVEINLMIKAIADLKEKNASKYAYFLTEIKEIKNYFYLDKKIWKQLLIGKIYDMEHNNIINMTHRKILLSKLNILVNSFKEK